MIFAPHQTWRTLWEGQNPAMTVIPISYVRFAKAQDFARKGVERAKMQEKNLDKSKNKMVKNGTEIEIDKKITKK